MFRKATMLTAVALALLLSNSATAAEPEEVSIAGRYSCKGTNPTGGTYSGTVVITKKKDTYQIRWTIGSGEAYQGVAIRNKDVLSVCFASGNAAGVVSYKIGKNRKGLKLIGKWSVLGGDGKTYTETLTLVK